MSQAETILTCGEYLRANILTFLLVYTIEAVLLPITLPGERDALTAVSTLPLVLSALRWWRLTVLDTRVGEKKKSLYKIKSPAVVSMFRFMTPHFSLYLLIGPVFAVVLAIAEPLFLQALVAVWTSQLRRAARGSCATHLIGVVAAVGVSITSQTLRHTLTTSTAILMGCTGYQTWREKCQLTCVVMLYYSTMTL